MHKNIIIYAFSEHRWAIFWNKSKLIFFFQNCKSWHEIGGGYDAPIGPCHAPWHTLEKKNTSLYIINIINCHRCQRISRRSNSKLHRHDIELALLQTPRTNIKLQLEQHLKTDSENQWSWRWILTRFKSKTVLFISYCETEFGCVNKLNDTNMLSSKTKWQKIIIWLGATSKIFSDFFRLTELCN